MNEKDCQIDSFLSRKNTEMKNLHLVSSLLRYSRKCQGINACDSDSFLMQVIEKSYNKSAGQMQMTCGLRHAGLIELPDFKHPAGIAYTKENTLLVSDYQKHTITHLTTGGDVLHKISKGLKNPGRFFQDGQGNLWVCDIGNSRILLMDDEYKCVVNEISIPEILADGAQKVSPISGGSVNGRFFLLLSGGDHYENRLISFRPQTPQHTLEVIDPSERINIMDFKVWGDSLLLCANQPSLILKYTPASHRISTLFSTAVFSPFISLATRGTEIYINQSKSICRVSEKGEYRYHMHVRPVSGNQVYIVDMSIGHNPSDPSPSLFLTDCLNLCIHQFHLDGAKNK